MRLTRRTSSGCSTPAAARRSRRADTAAQSLRIAAVPTAAESFVPGLMQAFGEAHRDAELTLVVGNNEEVLARVLRHEDDIAISGRPPTSERLIAKPFLPNETICITSADDPTAAGGPVAASTLTDRSWLLREAWIRDTSDERTLPRRPGTRAEGADTGLERCNQAGRPRATGRVVDLASGRGELSFRDGALGEIRLTDGPEARSWFVVHSAVGPSRPLVERFSDFARTTASAGNATA